MADDDLDQALRTLPAHDVDPWRREHARLAARRALGRPPLTGWRRAYRRFIEPAVVFAFCAAHLAWTFATTAALLLP